VPRIVRLWRVFPIEDIVLEVAFSDCAVLENHLGLPALDPSAPVPLVDCPISKEHLSIPVPLILLILSFVDISRLPDELSIAMLLVIHIITLILVRGRVILLLPPDAFSIL